MASVKFIAVSHGLKGILDYVTNREDFITCMEAWGYGVKWEPEQKYITYTTPDNVRCRDSKLFDQTLLRENMELYFAMGGRSYLESRQDWKEYGEAQLSLDDAVCGLASIFEALAVGDNDRFHLETVHHSEEEIERMLTLGKKIERGVVIAVNDEEEEYQQYHGFGMGGMLM